MDFKRQTWLANQFSIYLALWVWGVEGVCFCVTQGLLSGIAAIASAIAEPCLQKELTEGEGEIPRWADAGTPPKLAK